MTLIPSPCSGRRNLISPLVPEIALTANVLVTHSLCPAFFQEVGE